MSNKKAGCGLVGLIVLIVGVIWAIKAWSSGNVIEVAMAVFVVALAIAILGGLEE